MRSMINWIISGGTSNPKCRIQSLKANTVNANIVDLSIINHMYLSIDLPSGLYFNFFMGVHLNHLDHY